MSGSAIKSWHRRMGVCVKADKYYTSSNSEII
jgi:hypothetical protein